MKRLLSTIIFIAGVLISYWLALLVGAAIDDTTGIRQLAWLAMIVVFGGCLFILVYFGRKYFAKHGPTH